jgi:hypothetical protein
MIIYKLIILAIAPIVVLLENTAKYQSDVSTPVTHMKGSSDAAKHQTTIL